MPIPPVPCECLFPDGFWTSTISGGIVGLAASYAASFFFLHSNNRNHRPAIEVSPQLIKSKRPDNTPSLLIKVLNHTDQDIADIMFEVEGVKNLSPKGSIPLLDLTQLGKRTILYIKKFNKDDEDAHYAHRIHLYKEDGDILSEMSKFDKIRVSIRAACPYYGTSIVSSKDYDVNKDILSDNNFFNTGNSLSISSH